MTDSTRFFAVTTQIASFFLFDDRLNKIFRKIIRTNLLLMVILVRTKEKEVTPSILVHKSKFIISNTHQKLNKQNKKGA